MKSLKNYILAISVTSILIIYAGSVALPTLTTVPAFATHDTTTDTTDDTTTDTTDNNNNDTMLFLIDVIQCFPNNDINNDLNGNDDDEQFSEDVEVCLNNIIGQYFNNDDNLDNNNDSQDNTNINSDENNTIEPSSQET